MTDAKAGPDDTSDGPAFGIHLSDDTALWIVRHGETEWSRSGQHTGSTDIALTDAGEAQARALEPMLSGVHPVFVLSSASTRALDTARLAGIEVDETTPELGEWDYGDYEGLTTEQIHESVPDWNVFSHGCPDGESVAEVGARADRLLSRILPRLAQGPVMLFGHGHFSRVLGARWIGAPTSAGANLLLGTAAPSVLGAEHGAPALAHWNISSNTSSNTSSNISGNLPTRPPEPTVHCPDQTPTPSDEGFET